MWTRYTGTGSPQREGEMNGAGAWGQRACALTLGPPSWHFRWAQGLRAPSKPAQALLLTRSASCTPRCLQVRHQLG